jgi:hypothetical protein
MEEVNKKAYEKLMSSILEEDEDRNKIVRKSKSQMNAHTETKS